MRIHEILLFVLDGIAYTELSSGFCDVSVNTECSILVSCCIFAGSQLS